MSRRYSDILKAARDLPYLENYIAWMTSAENRQPNVGKGKPRKKSQKLAIVPFTIGLPANQYAVDSGALDSWEKYSAQIGNHARVITTALAANTIPLDRFSAARVHVTTGMSTEPIVKTSHITKRKYTSHGGTSTSLPFGKTSEAATETEADVFALIEVNIATELAGAAHRITLTPEKSRIVSVA